MAIRFFNTLSRTVEPFNPIKPQEVSIYTCGPTVYNFVHLGNWRAFSFYDLLKRYLRYRGFTVHHVMNITDIDDKTIKGSQQAGQSLKQFTEHYTKEFLVDANTLRLLPPDKMPKATEEIESMVTMIETLMSKGHAYKNQQGDIYFKIDSFSSYGQIAQLDKQKLKENAEGRLARADEYEKEDARDFALWKSWTPEDGEVFWETRIGKGRPGWHIECSAMASTYLGESIDIHCGGIDLVFPHHTNEIAQSECSCGKQFAKYWMHNSHLMVNGKKMAKSAHNFYTLRDLLAKGIDPLVVRYELLKTHYRSQLDFREDSLSSSIAVVRKIRELFERLSSAGSGTGWKDRSTTLKQTITKVIEAMDDDLNVAPAIAAILELISAINVHHTELSALDVSEIQKVFGEFDSIFGFFVPAAADIPAEILALAKLRDEARKSKDFKRSDELRDQITALGYQVKDTAQGTKVSR